jgi:hypothetical protein
MPPSDSVIHLAVSFRGLRLTAHNQMLHLEINHDDTWSHWCRWLCIPWDEKLFSNTVLKREYAHGRVWWTAY